MPMARRPVPAMLPRQAVDASNDQPTHRTLFAGDYIQPAAQARQLVWNWGAGLQRDSAILQNATRARIYVDPQGRRSMRMSTLGSVAGTAAGDQSYR